MIELWVESSGENPALAQAELSAVVKLLDGRRTGSVPFGPSAAIHGVRLPSMASGKVLADRLALAHRVLRPLGSGDRAGESERLLALARSKTRVRFRVRDSTRQNGWRPIVDAFLRAGGLVDLEQPAVTVDLLMDARSVWWVAEEQWKVDRAAYEARRPSRLPFRRPVTLPPRLARVLVNLAGIRRGDHVVDPFFGTGALAAEVALVGARISGIDESAEMIRGALANFRFLHVEADELRVGDAADAFGPASGAHWEALVTDPPYGRSSSVGGVKPEELVTRVIQAWAPRITAHGRIALIVPSGTSITVPGWREEIRIPHRAHRSLTREFRVLRRPGERGRKARGR